ncbi:MAG: hypothetical protein OXE40_04450, partial [Gammaproteobacteria bacterium]|nr:hypothetical protein [Gammaproteobacteria bacterium]
LLNPDPGAAREPVDCPGVPQREGVIEWRGQACDARLVRAVRVVPDDLWDAFFVCRIVKGSPANELFPNIERVSPAPAASGP